MVVVVVVVVAIVLGAVCSVRRRKKYDLNSIVTYEVPPDTHIGKLVSFCTLHAQTATNCSPASSPTFPPPPSQLLTVVLRQHLMK